MELKPTMHMIGCDWLMGCDTKYVTYKLTKLQMAVNAWVAFTTKKQYKIRKPNLSPF